MKDLKTGNNDIKTFEKEAIIFLCSIIIRLRLSFRLAV